MAKYHVTYSCGHDGEVQLFGPRAERERKLAWYHEVAVCPDCYRARQKAEAAQLTEGLVELTGTEKQVAWATELRAKLVRELSERYPAPVRAKDDKSRALFALLDATINELAQAKWWIDNRDDLIRAISPLWQAKAREAGLL